jgi:opacity protein-like surface antigen
MWSLVIATAVFLGTTAVSDAQTSWSGAYVGGGVGWTSFDDVLAEETALINGVAARRNEPRAATGHVFGGYRWSNGPMVWGSEAELQFGNGTFRATECSFDSLCAASGIIGRVSTTGRLRFVAGYSLDDRTLLLGSVGITAARVTVNGLFASASTESGGGTGIIPFDAPVRRMATGYSLGLGLERLVSERLSMQFGLLYDRLNMHTGQSGSVSVFTTDLTDESSASAVLSDRLGFRNLSVRISAVYRF